MADRLLLCVDDESSVQRSLKRSLRKEDFQVLTASGGREGLALLEQHAVQVVLSDQRMPGMKGTEFLQQVKERFPETVRVMLSGYAEVHAILDSINKGEIYRFLPKPWDDDELKVILRQCFEQHDLIRQNRELLGQIRDQNDALQRLNDDLERTVEERTRTLHFAQDVVEKLPQAVLGITQEGFAVLANETARQLLADTAFFFGADVDVFLPIDVIEAVTLSLSGKHAGFNKLTFSLKGHMIRSEIISLGHNHTTRGCILLMEVQ